jgi:hypothetical protein
MVTGLEKSFQQFLPHCTSVSGSLLQQFRILFESLFFHKPATVPADMASEPHLINNLFQSTVKGQIEKKKHGRLALGTDLSTSRHLWRKQELILPLQKPDLQALQTKK